MTANNGYRGVGPEHYRVTTSEITATVLASSEQDWAILWETATRFTGAMLVPLKSETPEQQRAAARAYYEAQVGQVTDRQQKVGATPDGREVTDSVRIDREVVYAAVGRALLNGGRVGRLTLTSSNGDIMNVVGRFGDILTAKSRQRHIKNGNGSH